MEKNHQDMLWVPHADIAPEPCGPGVQRRILAYGRDAMCVENTFEKGAVGALHSHPHTQVDYLLEGEIDMQVGDEVRRMHAGDIVQVPGNVPHAFCKVYRDTRWLEFFTPAREDILPREEPKEKE